MEKKRLVPKNRLKEMMKWLNDNPGKSQKDFVNEVVEMEKLEVIKPKEKKKVDRKKRNFDRFCERNALKLQKISSILKQSLDIECELVDETTDKIYYKEDKLVISKFIIKQRSNIPVIVANAILESKKSDKEKLELFKSIFGNIVTVQLLK